MDILRFLLSPAGKQRPGDVWRGLVCRVQARRRKWRSQRLQRQARKLERQCAALQRRMHAGRRRREVPDREGIWETGG